MQAAKRDDDRTLRRIAATLIALAVLAERVSLRSCHVRCLVLCFLRPAEAIARKFVAELTQTQWLAGASAIGNGPEDAIRLAMRFRALAAVLGALLRAACRSACPDARMDGAARCLEPHSGRVPVTPGGRQPKLNDTS